MNRDVIILMLKKIERIEEYCKGLTKEKFLSSPMVMDAVLLNIELLGEYVNKLDDYYKEDKKDIPWNAIKGMRNRIAHDYDGLMMDILWDIVENDIPDLKNRLEKI